MRLLIVFLLIGSVAAQQQAAFQAKFMKLVSNFLGANTGKAMDLVAQDVLAEQTIQQVVEHLMKNVISLVPSNKVPSSLAMLSAFTGCMSKAGSSMDKAMTKIGAAFQAKLGPLYKKVMKKVKTMKKAKKDDKAILNQGFKIATAGLTKKLVQGIINVCMTKSTKAEYDCSLPALNVVMQTSQYNMVYDAKRG